MPKYTYNYETHGTVVFEAANGDEADEIMSSLLVWFQTDVDVHLVDGSEGSSYSLIFVFDQ